MTGRGNHDSAPAQPDDGQLARLEAAYSAPVWQRPWRLASLAGPGFTNAALTLGAGSLTAAMISGAEFGYRLLWVIVVAIGLELFLRAGMARLACVPGFRLISAQNRYHGAFVGTFLTATVGCLAVAVVFNYGQVVLGTHIMGSMADLAGVSVPRWLLAVVYFAITVSVLIAYERGAGRGARLVQQLMKLAIAGMLLAFVYGLFRIGVDWDAVFEGLFVPWLPPGKQGIDLLLAKVGAAAGVMCWVFFVTAGRDKQWNAHHEKLARFDLFAGMFLPFVLINAVVICLFAGTLFQSGTVAETAQDLARALAPAFGETLSQLVFYIGFLAVPLTTTIAMSLAGAMALFDALNLDRERQPWLWRALVLLPQVALIAIWVPEIRPLWLVVGLAALMVLTNNIVAWSLYLLLNDDRVLERRRQPGFLWNLGIVVHASFLNCAAILYVFNRFG